MSEPLKLMRRRHSSRVRFDRARPVSRDALLQILEAGRWAPTAHNMQNFQIVVVDDPALVEQLGRVPVETSAAFIRENYAQLSFSEDELRHKGVGILASMFPPSWRTPDPDMAQIALERGDGSLHDTIQDSPALLVVTCDPSQRAPASEGDFLGAISLGCVLQNMWLMAESLDVAFQVMSVFSGEHTEPTVKELLAIPAPLRVAFAVRIGYPTKLPRALRVRRALGDVVHHNRFGAHDLH